MNTERIDAGHWRLHFNEPEAIFVVNVLARLGLHYQEDVAKLPPALRAYWQGTLSRGGSEKKELQEAQELLAEARAELRAERLALVNDWVREFDLAEERDPWMVEITSVERDEFVAMLNDRRLMLAAELGLSEEEMARHPGELSASERRQALFEIDILGQFILATLGPQIHRS